MQRSVMVVMFGVGDWEAFLSTPALHRPFGQLQSVLLLLSPQGSLRVCTRKHVSRWREGHRCPPLCKYSAAENSGRG